MSKSHVLSKTERQLFNSPPIFTAEGRMHYFHLTEELIAVINKMSSKTNKIGFVLGLGYFKYANRFFMPNVFHKKDIVFVAKLLNIKTDKFDAVSYNDRTFLGHKKLILTLQNVVPFETEQQQLFSNEIDRLVAKKIRPKTMVIKLCEWLKQNKIEIPSYNRFADTILHSQSRFESQLIETLKMFLKTDQQQLLDELLPDRTENEGLYQRSPLTKMKIILLSTRPAKIKENVNVFSEIKKYFEKLKPVIDALKLSPEALKYYATWIYKARTLQLAEWKKPYKRYLYLLAFISHQYYQRQDLLVNTLLKSVRSTLNNVKNKEKQLAAETKKEKELVTQKLSKSYREKHGFMEKVKEIIFSVALNNKQKIDLIRKLIVEGTTEMTVEQENEFLTLLDNQLIQSLMHMDYYNLLESSSIALQNRISCMLKHIQFNPVTSDTHLIEAIESFKNHESNLGKNASLRFLDKEQRKIVINNEGKFRTSLYKALLFISIADAVKAGTLNLIYSYDYLSLDEYLIPRKQWELERETLIRHADLEHFVNFNGVIGSLKELLHKQYCDTNDRVNSGENAYITFNKQGKIIVKTPKLEKFDEKRMADLMPQNKYIAILDVLTDIDRYTSFSTCFQHYSIRDKKESPLAILVYAGLLGKGCNIGINKLANTSKGITEDKLENIVNWYFTQENILSANIKLIQLANKLALPRLLKRSLELLHTSSDGKKRVVDADSLIADQSFKYLGTAKGVSVYDFIDERHLLFHASIISSTEREAHYVIDGLLNNEEIKSNIHSTDSHGYTDLIFAVMHLLGRSFAPRLAKIKDRVLYAFKAKKIYINKGYKIVPGKSINLTLLKQHWDEILHFMASIKLKQSTVSKLFKRLSSYAKENPLYKALKEFGRITKTLFLLTYMNDAALRQAIQKQLNKVELSNKFSDAVFFANNQEFQQGSQEDQETAMNCRMLIQNAIVLWNYLHLSQTIANCDDKNKVEEIIVLIKKGSMMKWRPINFNGEFDFREKVDSHNPPFDIDKILELDLVA